METLRGRAAGDGAALRVLAAVVVAACGPGGGEAERGGAGAADAPGAAPPGAAREGTASVRPADASASRYGVRLTTDRAVYAPGDTIRMRLEVVRRGGPPLTFSFPTAQRHDFVLRGPEGADPTPVRWRWSEGRFFAQVTGTLTLDDERPAVTATASHPAPGDPGTYRLEGRISDSDWPVSAVVPITVTP